MSGKGSSIETPSRARDTPGLRVSKGCLKSSAIERRLVSLSRVTTYAYIRTSTAEQNAALQRDAIAAAGIPEKHVYVDEGISGTLATRPRLDALLDRLDDGDEVVVWKLDRLGRNTRNVLELVETMRSKGTTFRSLTEGIGTGGPMGEAMLTIMTAFAQLERDTLIERTRAGLASARAAGRLGGRPPRVDDKLRERIRKLAASGDHTRTEIAEMLQISRATLYRALQSL